MYSFITAFAKDRNLGQSWEQVDLGQTTLYDMQSTYSKIYLHIESSFEAGIIKRLDWDDVRRDVVDLSITLNQYLANNGNKTLPTYSTLCFIREGVVRYADAVQAGYRIDIINRLFAPGSSNSYIGANDIRIRKEGVVPSDFRDHCLATVNDLIHFVDSDSTDIYITEAMKSCKLSGRNELGIINFKDVSKITCIPLKPEMIFKAQPPATMSDRFYVKMPPIAKNKLVGIVLGGYLHLRTPDSWWSVSDDVYAFAPSAINLVDRIFESEGIIDLSSLELIRAGKSGKQLSKEQLFSDEVIMKYATLSQSFLVVFDNPDIMVDKIAVQKTNLPGMYQYPTKPDLPLIYKRGMLASYRFERDQHTYAIRTTRNDYNHYLSHTTTVADNPADNRVPHDPRKPSHASFWKASALKIEFK